VIAAWQKAPPEASGSAAAPVSAETLASVLAAQPE